MFPIPGVLRPIMGGLHTDDNVGILFDCFGTKHDIHLIDGLLQPAIHAVGHDVQESQNAHSGMIDDFFFFLKKSFSSGSPSIHHRGHT